MKAGSEGPGSFLKSCAISRRATVLGRKRWALGDLRAVCLVRATGHRHRAPSLSSLSCSAPSLSRHAGRHRHAIACLHRAVPKAVHESESLRVICPSHLWERSEDSDFTDPMFFGSQSHSDLARRVKFTSDPPVAIACLGPPLYFRHINVPARCMPHRH